MPVAKGGPYAAISGGVRGTGSPPGRFREPAAQADPDQAKQLVDLLRLLDVDAALLAEWSFRELLAALDLAGRFHPDKKELRVGAILAPEFVPVGGDGMSVVRQCPRGCSAILEGPQSSFLAPWPARELLRTP
jgi:hypothetical protein